LNSKALGTEKAYLVSMSGTVVEVRFPHLKTLANSPKLIHKAELVLPVLNDKNEPYPPHQQLLVAKLDSEGNESVTPDQVEGASHFGGAYDEANDEIKMRLTRSVQILLNLALEGEPINPVFNIVPGDDIPGGSAVNAFRTVIGGTQNQSPEGQLKLIISYTPLN
jgi:hypothetical protein